MTAIIKEEQMSEDDLLSIYSTSRQSLKRKAEHEERELFNRTGENSYKRCRLNFGSL